MISVGITGGIGSGKTHICKVFGSLGIPVFHSDEVARRLMQTDASVIEKVISLLGEQAYEDGRLIRSFIAERVFSDRKLLDQLNAIVHPAVGRHFLQWLSEQKDVPYAIKEAAILFESGADKGLDFVIMVTAPEKLRIQRIIMRDQTTGEQVIRRMKNQWSEEKKVKLADYTIVNDDKHPVIPQVLRLHSIFCKKSNKTTG